MDTNSGASRVCGNDSGLILLRSTDVELTRVDNATSTGCYRCEDDPAHPFSFTVGVEKLTDKTVMQWAAANTTRRSISSIDTFRMYKSEHSPIRTQIFLVDLLDIPTFVSVHLRTHKFGVEHFVLSNRDDRGGALTVDRYTPVNHGLFLNAQALINISRRRLCHKAHILTRRVWEAVREQIRQVDCFLADVMVPECIYRGNVCHEFKCCGEIKGVMWK